MASVSKTITGLALKTSALSDIVKHLGLNDFMSSGSMPEGLQFANDVSLADLMPVRVNVTIETLNQTPDETVLSPDILIPSMREGDMMRYSDNQTPEKEFKRVHGSKMKCTCETCNGIEVCPGAWDAYNINGDCLMDK